MEKASTKKKTDEDTLEIGLKTSKMDLGSKFIQMGQDLKANL